MRKRIRFQSGEAEPPCQAAQTAITIRLDLRTLEYFQQLARELEVPYQTLINLYLRDCGEAGRRPAMKWRTPRTGAA
jgi:hypothetical protein